MQSPTSGSSSSDVAITILPDGAVALGKPFFREDKFDGEVIRHMVRWLMPRDLCQLSVVEKQFRSLTRDAEMWAEHYRRDFPHVRARDADNAGTKKGYLEQIEVREKIRTAQREEELLHQARMRYRDKRGVWNAAYHVLQETCMPCVLPPLVLLFTVFGILTLTDGGPMLWAYASPMIVFIYLLSCATCLLCYVATFDDPYPFSTMAWERDESPITKIYKKLGEGNFYGNVLGIVTFSLALLSVLFICLKVTSSASFSWTIVAVPLIVAICLLLLCCGYAKYKITMDAPHVAGFRVALCGLLVFIVLGAKALDHVNIPVGVVLIPFFIFDIIAFVACLITCWKSDWGAGCLAVWTYLLLFGTFTAFHVMLSLYFDAPGNYGLTLWEIFVPLLVVEGLVVLLLWVGCISWSKWDDLG